VARRKRRIIIPPKFILARMHGPQPPMTRLIPLSHSNYGF
jgi:hypothetical protein